MEINTENKSYISLNGSGFGCGFGCGSEHEKGYGSGNGGGSGFGMGDRDEFYYWTIYGIEYDDGFGYEKYDNQ